jgi:hypothetical protein
MTAMTRISVTKAADMLQQAKNANDGRNFSVKFIKRTTGELRQMTCRFGVTQHLTGEGSKYEPSERGLICVFDTQKGQYRTINMCGITWMKIAGQEYEIEDNA